MKKISLILVSVMMTVVLSNEAIHADDTGIKLNRRKFYMNFNECNLLCNNNVYEFNGKDYYPIRNIVEKMGFGIDWNEETETILIDTKTDSIFPYKQESYIDNVFVTFFGCKDIDGNIVVEPEYTYVSDMSCDLLSVRSDITGKYKYGYINNKGEIIIPCIYSEATDFSDGLALVRTDEVDFKSCYFINTEGDRVSDLNFYDGEVGRFSNGYAPIMKQGISYPISEECDVEDVWSYIDKDFNSATDMEFQSAFSFDEDGYACVEQNGKWGAINTDFNFVVDCKYDNMEDAYEALSLYNCTFGNFKINVAGSNVLISDGIVVVNDKTYLSVDDIQKVLNCKINKNGKVNDVLVEPGSVLFIELE